MVDDRPPERRARGGPLGTSSPARARPCRSRASRGGCGPGRAAPGRCGSRRPPRRAGSTPARGRCRRRSRRARRAGRRRSRTGSSSAGCCTPGVSFGHEDHALAAVALGVGVGDAHHDQQLAARRHRARRPPLAPVDDVVVAVALDARRDVGARRRTRPSGSVIENAERISPSSSGSSHRSFCSAVPNSDSSSMLPVSGAEQLSASGAIHGLRPVISASGAYCRFVSPAPCSWAPAGTGSTGPAPRASSLELLDDRRGAPRVGRLRDLARGSAPRPGRRARP